MTDYEIGKGRPPTEHQFRPGVSGNPKGRPRGSRKRAGRLPYPAVLDEMVPVQKDGDELMMRADRAFLLHLVRQIYGPSARVRLLALDALKINRDLREHRENARTVVYKVYAEPGDVNDAMALLGAGHIVDLCEPSARFLLEPWAVTAALDRLGDHRLSLEEQAIVVEATRRPSRVRWPAWWSVTDARGSGELHRDEAHYSDDVAIERDS